MSLFIYMLYVLVPQGAEIRVSKIYRPNNSINIIVQEFTILFAHNILCKKNRPKPQAVQ